MSIRDIPPLSGEIARIRYSGYTDDKVACMDVHYEAVQDPDGEYKEPPEIPQDGIAIIFPDEEALGAWAREGKHK